MSLAKIQALQAAISTLPQADGFVTTHHFAGGLYGRELFRPAGTLIVGKLHKKDHFYIVLAGEIEVYGVGRIRAPAVFVSQAGSKRAVYAHTDAICMTVHRTDETDLEGIEADLIEPEGNALFDARNQLKALP